MLRPGFERPVLEICRRVGLASLALAAPASAQSFGEHAKLLPSLPSSEFGTAVSVSGATLVVGGFGRGPLSAPSGPAYVFVRDGTSWSEQARLVVPGTFQSDHFGASVSLSGDTALVGAPLRDFPSPPGGDLLIDAGAAYVFVRSGTTWTLQATLVPSEQALDDQFGTSVSLSGDTAVVGNLRGGDDEPGAAFVFVRTGTRWTQQAILRASVTAPRGVFGTSVAACGERIVVGDPFFELPGGVQNVGAAYVFVRAGSSWTEEARLLGAGAEAHDQLGASVSISGDTLVAGAPFDDRPFSAGAQGSARVFVRSGGAWTEQATLFAAENPVGGDNLGSSVSLAGDRLVAGATRPFGPGPGRAYVFEREGATWTQRATLLASDGLDDERFGTSVALHGATVVVGEIGDETRGHDAGAAYVYAQGSGPCLTLDFETEDDLVTPLANGQHVDTEFGRVVSLSSSGENAGLAIFDSTVGGPNDPSQDRDLLVGSGNLLILQTENFPPDADDVFPRPNDDEDGGAIVFSFASPAEPRSLALVDVDSGDGGASVVLTDASGLQRVYAVPRDWTGDLSLGQPGRGSLDLSTLAPQPGFASSATASEHPGFERTAVVRIEVRLDGSGGVDDLAACLSGLPAASATSRNGAGSNPAILAAESLPVLGGPFRAVLDCSAFDGGRATLVVRARAAEGTHTPQGELLVGGALLQRTTRPCVRSLRRLAIEIPYDLSLCGAAVHVQGLCHGTSGGASPRLRSAGRLSNALDLVLGL